MKRLLFRFKIVLLAAFASASGCKIASTEYGAPLGSFVGPLQTAQKLISSRDCVVQIDSGSPVVNGGFIDSLTNKITSFSTVSAPLDFLPNNANLGTISAGWIRLSPTSSNQEFATDISKMIASSEGTVIALVKNDSRGDLVSMNPQDRLNQAFELRLSATEVKTIFRSSPSDDFTISEPLPARDEVLVAASFDSSANIDFSVNGSLVSTPVVTGTPLAPFSTPRIFAVGSSVSGELTNIKELYVFRRKLTRYEMGSMLQLIIANQSISGITLNSALTAGSQGSTLPPLFVAARTVIENKCVSCHAGWSNSRPTTFTSLGLVVARDAENSKLYYRLSNSTGVNGPKNMPGSGSVTSQDTQAIKDWIDSL